MKNSKPLESVVGLITLEELLGIFKNNYSKWTVYQWVRQGIPHRKIRGKLWFPKKEAIQWITKGL